MHLLPSECNVLLNYYLVFRVLVSNVHQQVFDTAYTLCTYMSKTEYCNDYYFVCVTLISSCTCTLEAMCNLYRKIVASCSTYERNRHVHHGSYSSAGYHSIRCKNLFTHYSSPSFPVFSSSNMTNASRRVVSLSVPIHMTWQCV